MLLSRGLWNGSGSDGSRSGSERSRSGFEVLRLRIPDNGKCFQFDQDTSFSEKYGCQEIFLCFNHRASKRLLWCGCRRALFSWTFTCYTLATGKLMPPRLGHSPLLCLACHLVPRSYLASCACLVHLHVSCLQVKDRTGIHALPKALEDSPRVGQLNGC